MFSLTTAAAWAAEAPENLVAIAKHVEHSSPAGGARSGEGATELPPRVREYLKAALSADAEKVISVFGMVLKPQSIPAAESVTVSKAVEAAGGFSDFASRRKVRVWKANEGRYFTVDVKAVLQKKPDAVDPLLVAGDVVIVEPVCELRF